MGCGLSFPCLPLGHFFWFFGPRVFRRFSFPFLLSAGMIGFSYAILTFSFRPSFSSPGAGLFFSARVSGGSLGSGDSLLFSDSFSFHWKSPFSPT